MKSFLRQHALTLVGGLVLLIALPLAVILSQQTQLFQPRASLNNQEQSLLTLIPSTSTLSPGQQFTVDVVLDTTHDPNFVVTGVDAIIDINLPQDIAAIITPVSITNGTVFETLTQQTIEGVRITISASNSSVKDANGLPVGFSGVGTVATITFMATGPVDSPALLNFLYTAAGATDDTNIIGFQKDVPVDQQSPRERLLTFPERLELTITSPTPSLCWDQVITDDTGTNLYPNCPKTYNGALTCAAAVGVDEQGNWFGVRNLSETENAAFQDWLDAGHPQLSPPCVGVITDVNVVPGETGDTQDILVTFNRNNYQDPAIGPSATDWLGLFPAGTGDLDTYLSWLYTNGTQTATTVTNQDTVRFANVALGNYVIRFFLNNTRDIKVDEKSIEVMLPFACNESTIPPETGLAPLTVTLHGAGQANYANNTLLGYHWDFDGDGTWDTTDDTLDPATHVYDTPGVYQPKFRIHGSLGNFSQTCDYPYVVNAQAPPSLQSLTIDTIIMGVTGDVGPITATLTIGKMGETPEPQYSTSITLNFNNTNTDGQAIYTGTINFTDGGFPLSDSHNFWLALKGQKHLRRVFPYLSLTTDGYADLTTKSLEPGDLPDETGAQDGSINLDDINRVVATMAQPIQTQADLDVADVNYDGRVNAFDLGLILKSLSTKPDESAL